MTYTVSGPVAVVKVGEELRYLDHGAAVPEQADAESVEHLLAVGLIGKTEAVEPDAPAVEPDAPADEPPGEPAGGEAVDLDALNLDELRTYAAGNGIDIGDATRKADIRAAIDAASRV